MCPEGHSAKTLRKKGSSEVPAIKEKDGDLGWFSISTTALFLIAGKGFFALRVLYVFLEGVLLLKEYKAR